MINQKYNHYYPGFILFLFMLLSTSLYAQESTSRFFVFLNRNPDRAIISDDSAKTLQNGHMANIEALYKQGKLICAGPFENGGGIFIIVAKSTADAINLISGDPAIKANRFLIECFPLVTNYGNICRIDGEYKMVSYQFIRFRFNPDSKMPSPIAINQVYESHITYLSWLLGQSENLLFDADFCQWEGGFMLLNQADAAKVVEIANNDPLVKSGIYLPEIRKLFVAQGVFCENISE